MTQAGSQSWFGNKLQLQGEFPPKWFLSLFGRAFEIFINQGGCIMNHDGDIKLWMQVMFYVRTRASTADGQTLSVKAK